MLHLPAWAPWVYIAIATHLTNVSVTLFLHRSMAHGGLELSPILTVPMRIWIWLSTAMNTKEWVAIHRKHHIFTDKDGDPHSPTVKGILAIALAGWWHYHQAAKDKVMVEKYSKGCPDDWLERNLLGPHTLLGPLILGILSVTAFGWAIGLTFVVIQAVWMPICGDVINGIGHYIGYRNTGTKDSSRNIIPWGIVIAGEELHNNHHADPRSPIFRQKWYELDIGWIYIQFFRALRLARLT